MPGTYVVAVSGGVDSMVLLDILRRQPQLKLVVAHFDHGIRPDSSKDRKLVQDISRKHKLPFIHDEGSLGPDTSEDKARAARYDFLHRVRSASGSRAIITAHHKDDVIETAVMQLLRGTGRRGLSSLTSGMMIERPLLHLTKEELLRYAKQHNIQWREDSTNTDTKYLRNCIRHIILPRLSEQQRQQLHDLLSNMRKINAEIDQLLDIAMHMQPSRTSISRSWFIRLPHSVSNEVMAHWLRGHDIRGFSRRQLDKLVLDAKTLAPGQQVDVNKNYQIKITSGLLALTSTDR